MFARALRRARSGGETAGLPSRFISDAETLERITMSLMTSSIAHELDRPDGRDAPGRFRAAAERVMVAEVRLGWLRALNLQGSGGLAKLGPVAVVVVAAFAGTRQVGTLPALYRLAQRAFWGFDGLVDLSLNLQCVRGGVLRCFELIDVPTETIEFHEALPARLPLDEPRGANDKRTLNGALPASQSREQRWAT